MLDTEFCKQSKFDPSCSYADCFIKELETLSESYGSFLKQANAPRKIPKVIHQIWLGSKLPKKYEEYGQTIRAKNLDYEYILWTDEKAKNLKLRRQKEYDEATSYGVKSDILRLEILYQFGGIYFDTDFELFGPLPEKFLTKGLVVGLAFGKRDEYPVYGNAFIMSEKEAAAIDELLNNEEQTKDLKNADKVMDYLGPYAITRAVRKSMKSPGASVLVLPSDIFYPWPSFAINLVENRYDYVKDISVGMHHWETSWISSWMKMFIRLIGVIRKWSSV